MRVASKLREISGLCSAVSRLSLMMGGLYLVGAPVAAAELQPAPGAAPATAESDADQRVGEIVVTATRLGRRDVPTPMIEVGKNILLEGARPSVAAALNDLPQFRSSISPQTTGASTLAGTWALDLRGLGVRRTLVLLDGRRLAHTYSNPDAAVIPSILIGSVDVVTGSASAAWGSNAVAGVVNLKLDRSLNGVRIGSSYGISERGDGKQWRLEAALGTDFANGRGHFIIGADYFDDKGAGPRTTRANIGRWAVIANPNFTATNGQKPLLIAPDTGNALASPGGLIRTGVNAGRAFNPDGTLRPFDLGTVIGATSVGGEAPNNDDYVFITPPNKRYNILARADYDITDDANVFFEARHARAYGDFPFFTSPTTALTISRDNAFLPAAIRAQMVAAGETSFTLGRFNADFSTIGLDFERKNTQITAGFDAKISDGLTLSGYATHGTADENWTLYNTRNVSNFNSAVDSVLNAAGQPICRIALTNPTTNCVPINLFGEGAPSLAAANYVRGDSFQKVRTKLDAGGLTLRGEPFSLWSGPVAVALGAEIRRESISARVSPLDQLNALSFTNFKPFAGRNTTKEGFAEILVPLVQDVPLLQNLKFNGAARATHDQSGTIWSWKLGLINEIVDGLSVRFTRSRDIRSADVEELYSAITGPGFQNITDRANGNASYLIQTFGGGNPALDPEVSRTLTFGATINPRFSRNLRIAVDYYDVKIANAIASITPQNTINLCASGVASACGRIERGSDNLITRITASIINYASLRNRGLDATVDYSTELFGADRLSSRTSFTAVFENSQNDTFTTTSFLGSLTGSPGSGGLTGVPRYRVTQSLTYERGRVQGNVRARYISSVLFDRNRLIENNRRPAYVIFDLGVKYRAEIGDDRELEFYANVNNLLDKDPPPASSGSAYYDLIGRYFTFGVSAKF